MKIEIRKSAIKDLKAISEPFKSKLHAKILELTNFPNLSNIKKLTNRVLFDVLDDTIIIGRILHRQHSYE
jgi:mRNA interferase RelE/StbE